MDDQLLGLDGLLSAVSTIAPYVVPSVLLLVALCWCGTHIFGDKDPAKVQVPLCPEAAEHYLAAARRRRDVESVRAVLSELLERWGGVDVDPTARVRLPALYLESVPSTASWNAALGALSAAVDDLTDEASPDQIDAAKALAEEAWNAWLDAYDYAERSGLHRTDTPPQERDPARLDWTESGKVFAVTGATST